MFPVACFSPANVACSCLGLSLLLALSLAASEGNGAVSPKPVRLTQIPDFADLVFQEGGFVHVMDRSGERVAQITHENARHWEHVAVSHDHRYLAGDAHGALEGTYELWVFDLERDTETRLLPDYRMAGVGGVAWGPDGYLYFAASKTGPPHQFVYKIGPDASGLTQLTDINSVDVSVSPDGQLVTFMHVAPGGLAESAADHHTEVWVVQADGSDARPIYRDGGAMGVASVHDPEISSGNDQIIFSKVNPAFKNWPDRPGLNTAHDLWVVNLDGSDLKRVTPPGAISIIPNWLGEWIVYCELNEQENYMGMALIRPDGTGKKRLRPGFGFAKWIP